MSDFRTNIRNALDALVKVGYDYDDALNLIWRDSPNLFLKYFTDKEEDKPNTYDDSGYYRIDVHNNVAVVLSVQTERKLKDKGVIVSPEDYGFLLSNRKITAIKFVRALTGWDLLAAKQFVEGMTKYLTDEQYDDLRDMLGNSLERQYEPKDFMGNMVDKMYS